MTATQVAAQQLMHLRARLARALSRYQPKPAAAQHLLRRDWAEADRATPAARREPRAKDGQDGLAGVPEPSTALAERWQAGHDAFARGEPPPDDPDAAEGWYWAENTSTQRRPR